MIKPDKHFAVVDSFLKLALEDMRKRFHAPILSKWKAADNIFGHLRTLATANGFTRAAWVQKCACYLEPEYAMRDLSATVT